MAVLQTLCADPWRRLNQWIAAAAHQRYCSRIMRIGKPLLIATTAIGLSIGIYEAFYLTGRMGFLFAAIIALFGAGIAWLIATARAEARLADKKDPGSGS